MKTEKQTALAAAEFAERWQGKGDEKSESQMFWTDLLQNVFGVEDVTSFITYEKRVKVDETTKFIDAYIPSTQVLIEQKSIDVDLLTSIKQSNGNWYTPYKQAKQYADNLPYSEHPRWIVTCNFQKFLVYDTEKPTLKPELILLKDLGKENYRLMFLVDREKEHISKEKKVSTEASEIVARIYDALLKQYANDSTETLRWLNILCVRIVFCLYAEDAGLFARDQFHDYLAHNKAQDMRRALRDLFEVLNTPMEKRSPYLDDELKAFQYTNGGLFEEEIEIPQFTEELRQVLLQNASLDFDWSEISPTIFGAMFESTLNPETRRSGGMHYTSIENIHKVIDPLFFNDLCHELDNILEEKTERVRKKKLEAYQDKLASLTFLDPACGSGNFLTEAYLSLRRLENEVIREMTHGQGQLAWEGLSPVKVSIQQFYGIEINDFAVAVATTALWISEDQMLKETEDIVGHSIDFLPLKSFTNIHEGNALRMDWQSLVPANLNYIMGNPPFVGYAYQTKEQKEDLTALMKGFGNNIDYVAGWYYKSSELIQNTNTRCALVSTNSITQGEQVAAIWKPMFEKFGIHFDFAHRTFRWDSEASLKAHVHCVIIGFSNINVPKIIYDNDKQKEASNINGYLLDAPNVFIESRKKTLCDVPEITKGSIPVDDGNLIIEAEEYQHFIQKEPQAQKYIRRFVGAREFLHNKPRYCLWLEEASPKDLSSLKLVRERLTKVRDFRLSSTKVATRKFADMPTRFMEIRQPKDNYIIVPSHSSENRRYIPLGFMSPEVICGNANLMIPNASLYHFGVLESNVHMAWMRAVCGRLEMRYRYSNDIVYNNFPWPNPTEEQRQKIAETAQAILDARALYPDSSLADLYDELTMPSELRKAHQDNDRAVMRAYGFDVKTMTESTCVAELFKMYQEMTK